MVIGRDISDADLAPVCVGSNQIECVTEFRYLGSIIDTSGRCSIDISSRIAAASRAFGSLRKPVFNNHHLSVRTKKNIFNACVVTILLYGAECWAPLQADIRRLSTFYMQCLRTVLGITRLDAWQERISNDQLLEMWGDKRPLAVRIRQRRLEWLGHVARMPPERIPKILLFGLLPPRRPPGGPRKHWKDCISADLKALNAVEGWYDLVDSRPDWRRMYRCFEPEPSTPNVHCQVCGRYFSRPSDEKRHKCLAERQKPVCNQAGACQCRLCQRWFRSPGGLATHRCDHGPAPNIEHPGNPVTPQCSTCHRSFKSSSGLARHKCDRTKRRTVSERADFPFECPCQRKF